MYKNEEKKSLNQYKDEDEDEKYIFLPFIAYLVLFQRKLNRFTDLNKGTKSLNHFVYILKICYSEKY